jgi:hypothetical protein
MMSFLSRSVQQLSAAGRACSLGGKNDSAKDKYEGREERGGAFSPNHPVFAWQWYVDPASA